MPQREIAGGDCGGEAVVEGFGDAQPGVDRIPTPPQRHLVQPQLAGVKEAEQLDLGERGPTQLIELVRTIFPDVPGVAGPFGPRRRQRQEVGRRDVDAAGRREQLAEVLEDRERILDMLDRLQEDDRVEAARLTVGLDQPPIESQVLAPVAKPRVVVRLRVGVDPDDAGGAARENLGAVALPARHVQHASPDDPGADPLIYGEMAAEPVVLGRNVGQRALSGERERRYAGGLIALKVGARRHRSTG
jgi:hypothetical protein